MNRLLHHHTRNYTKYDQNSSCSTCALGVQLKRVFNPDDVTRSTKYQENNFIKWNGNKSFIILDQTVRNQNYERQVPAGLGSFTHLHLYISYCTYRFAIKPYNKSLWYHNSSQWVEKISCHQSHVRYDLQFNKG